MLSTKTRLIDEINTHLEHGGIPLSSIVRKAVRLAQICGQQEYRMLFDMHLIGLRTNEKNIQVPKWPNDAGPPQWNVVEALLVDRALPDKGMISASLEEMESVYEMLIHPQLQNPAALTKLFERRHEFTAIFVRIRNRVMTFVRLVESTLETDRGSTNVSNLSLAVLPKVFIGHGRSTLWKDLKELISNRLKLPYDEFNREPTAGRSTKERLEEMLSHASFALLVMTAEDEHLDGSLHARDNVIHEVGLFQGRLGFSKAIVLMEEGCEEFSNIRGLTQIRFPKGNIMAVSEEIRRVLEREGILNLEEQA
jgi:hypothetical protein